MRLLYVENHRAFAETVIGEFLAAHSVVVVPMLARAKEIELTQFDAALVDFDLADGKGAEFVTWLRSGGALMPVVAASSHDDGNAALLDAGANCVCAKRDFARIATVLEDVRPLPERSSLPQPQPGQLAHAFTLAINAHSELSADLAALFQGLLFGQKRLWEAFVNHLILHTELRNVLLAHAHTLVLDLTGSNLPFVGTTLAAVPPFERAIFHSS